jgi:hypothetical protein
MAIVARVLPFKVVDLRISFKDRTPSINPVIEKTGSINTPINTMTKAIDSAAPGISLTWSKKIPRI